MASETRSRISGRRARIRTAKRPRATGGAERAGASASAPTAPHAGLTNEASKPTGPASFWTGAKARRAFALSLVVSVVLHGLFSPYTFLPDSGGMTFKDVDDELVVPIELMAVEVPEPPKPVEPPPPSTAEPDPNGTEPGAKKPDAGPKPKPKPDASALDAGADGEADGAPSDAGETDAEPQESGAPPVEGGVASGTQADAAPSEAGAVASGVKDGGAPKVGFSGLVTAGVTNVRLLLNVSLMRQHPVGARMGPLLNGIPQWADFMKGTQSMVDPIRDGEWLLIYGPSLIHTEKDAIFIKYTLPDAVVDQAISTLSKKYDKGGPYDAGVPGVNAHLGHADNSERVFLRVQPHEAAIVPPSKARDFALLLKQHSVDPGLRPNEILRLVVRDPYRQVAVPGLKFPESMTEVRIFVVPRAGGGADAYAEGECKDDEAAADVLERTKEMIARQNASVLVRIATRGLLNNVDLTQDGKIVKAHVTATREQLEGILQALAAQLGVQLPAPGGGAP